MNEIIVKENIKIENMIFEIRGKQVIFDSDVAMLFGYQTKDLNRSVRNNINRFPERYCFRLTEEEYKNLRCNFFTSSSSNNYGGRRYLPYVFTEYGITMLAGLLKSDVAVQVSLKIVDAFIAMRKYISNDLIKLNNHNEMLIDHEGRIKALENTFSKFENFSNEIFFEGQIWDAHSLLLDIFNSSKKSIVSKITILFKYKKRSNYFTSIVFTFLVNLDFSLSTLFLCTKPFTLALSKDLIANLRLFSAFSLLPRATALSVFLIAFLTVDLSC